MNSYLIPWDKADIGPRLGFAYNWREKTVIRGAYGIFYGGEENQGGNPNRGESAPFNESPQLNRPAGVSSFAPDPAFANGAPTQRRLDRLSNERLHHVPGVLTTIPRDCSRLQERLDSQMELSGTEGTAGTDGS